METLASRIAREGGLPEIDAVGWVIRVAFSVEQIHMRGSVHGRLSADGVLIASDKCTSEGRLIPLADLPENVAYHSPERELGEGGSQADDTWAVAVTLYLALSGSLPFSGSSDDDVRRKIRSVPAPPLAVFDVGDDTLQAIVDRALARNREERTASVADLRRELEGWRPDIGLDALPALLGDDEPDEEVTMMIQSDTAAAVRQAVDAAVAASAPKKIAPPRPSSVAPGPPDDGTLMLAPALVTPGDAAARPAPVKVELPGLVDEASAAEESDDPFAIPQSRADVPRVDRRSVPAEAPEPSSARGPSSARPPASGPVSSSPPRASSAPPAAPGAAVVAQPVPPVPGHRSWTSVIVLCLVVFVVGGVAAYLWSRVGTPGAAPPAGSSTPGTTAEPPLGAPAQPGTGRTHPPETPIPPPGLQAPTPPVPVGGPPATSGASAAVPAVTRPPAPPAGGVAACALPLFPADSFDAATDFSFVCAEADPIKGGTAVRTQLVRTHHNISEGMKEWALLGWYELAAFAVIRARCCPGAPPLQLPEVRVCASLPEVVGGITAAVAAATDASDKALKKAVDAYTTNVYCIVRSGIAARFGRIGNPQGGEDTTFLRFLSRVVSAGR